MHKRTVFYVRLKEGSLYNRFRIGFGVNLGVCAKIFGGKVHSSSELRVFRHLWSRSDALCSSIMYQGRNHWGVGGGGPTPQLSGGPQLLIQRFCRGVHCQASRVNLVYNTEEERKKKFFLLLL